MEYAMIKNNIISGNDLINHGYFIVLFLWQNIKGC
jgi:hypothetical protein